MRGKIKTKQNAVAAATAEVKPFVKDFTVVGRNLERSNELVRPSLTYWQDAWRRLKLNKLAMAAMIYCIALLIYAFVGSIIWPDYSSQHLMYTLAPPSKQFWFGTDELGRDMWARMIRGTKVSLSIGIIVTLLNMLVGIIIGGIAGYFGGKVDLILMRIVEIMMSVPDMLVMILLMTVLGGSVGTLIFALSLTGWTDVAQLVRGQVMQLKNNEYVMAARMQGASGFDILKDHMIPNSLGTIIVKFSMNIPGVIFQESSLSYIGLGVKIPEASWGNLAQAGAALFPGYLWLFFIPAIFFGVTMLAFNILGDGLRDALDPKMREEV